MTDKIKVLFVDDDLVLGNVVTLALETLGYNTHYQTSLAGIKSVMREFQPDIIVLDVEIGTQNGIDSAPELKAIAPDIPILFISSHVDSAFTVKALGAGGAAYLKKPFEIEELLAYINRYTATFHSKGIQLGIFSLDTEEGLLKKGNEVIKRLSQFECKLLKLLALNLNNVITREQIEQELWEGVSGSEQSLNNYVVKLRKYLAEDKQLILTTIPKVGYKLSKEDVTE